MVANYTYNALGQRISEQYDCNDSGNTGATDGVTDSYDPVFFIANDRQGRRVATFRGTDSNPKETFIYHANGSSQGYGPGLPGGVMLRDRDAICATPEKWASTAANSTRAERYFYFPDSKGSIMALVSAAGVLAEQYRYSPTGIPFGIPGGDMNADGVVQSGAGQTDLLIVNNTAYDVRKDLDLDGDVDSADNSIVSGANGRTAGRGALSSRFIANEKGLLDSEFARWTHDKWLVSNSCAAASRLGGMQCTDPWLADGDNQGATWGVGQRNAPYRTEGYSGFGGPESERYFTKVYYTFHRAWRAEFSATGLFEDTSFYADTSLELDAYLSVLRTQKSWVRRGQRWELIDDYTEEIISDVGVLISTSVRSNWKVRCSGGTVIFTGPQGDEDLNASTSVHGQSVTVFAKHTLVQTAAEPYCKVAMLYAEWSVTAESLSGSLSFQHPVGIGGSINVGGAKTRWSGTIPIGWGKYCCKCHGSDGDP